jgi:hypothetical protein
MVGTASSPTQIPSCLQLSHTDRCLEPLVCREARWGDKGTHSEHLKCNPCRDGHEDPEGCSLSPEGPGAKAFGSNMHNTCFPKCFYAPSNIVKYDGKTNPSVWLEDYRLACWAGGADDDLFIMQFIPIYLPDMARA